MDETKDAVSSSHARVICPHCNSYVLVPDPRPTRLTCPRCTEAFVLDPSRMEFSTAAEILPAQPVPFLNSAKAIWLSIGIATLILIAGVFSLKPWSRDVVQPAKVAETRVTGTTPPLALDGIRYLPRTTNVVVAVQPGALIAYAKRSSLDPRKVLENVGLPAVATNALNQSGITLEQIDHAVIGLSLDQDALPGLLVVLKLYSPLVDEERFLKNLKAEKKPVSGRPIYMVNLGLPFVLTKPDARTYMLSLTDTAFASADRPEEPGGKHLIVGLSQNVQEKLSPASWLWMATDSDRWSEKPVFKLVLKQAQLDRLSQTRALAVGLSFEPDSMAQIAISGRDSTAADRTREILAQFVGERATVERDGNWVMTQFPFDISKANELFRTLFAQLTDG